MPYKTRKVSRLFLNYTRLNRLPSGFTRGPTSAHQPSTKRGNLRLSTLRTKWLSWQMRTSILKSTFTTSTSLRLSSMHLGGKFGVFDDCGGSGHCKRLQPEWDSAAQQARYSLNRPVYFMKVDCDANPELKDRFAVKSFPTILYFE